MIAVNMTPRAATIDIHSVHFRVNDNSFIERFESEVKKLSKPQLRKVQRIFQNNFITLSSTLLMVKPVVAKSPHPVNGLPEIMPSEIPAVFAELLLYAVLIGIGLACLCGVLAGITMLFKMEKARMWLVRILKGTGVILLAPMVVMSLAYIFFLLFGGSEWFISPF